MHSIPYAPESMQPPSGCTIGIFPDTLKTYVELNRFILVQNLSGVYRIWLLCRALDPVGRGTVDLDLLIDALEQSGLNKNYLKRANQSSSSEIFFTLHDTYIEYRSLMAVCAALCVPPGRAIAIPTESIQSTESFRAALYTAWIAAQDSLMISRERLESLFNVSQDTQRRWEKLSGVEVSANVVEVSESDLQAAEKHIPTDNRLDDRLGQSYVWEYDGRYWYRTVNSYSAPHFQRGNVGNVRKVTRSIPVEFRGDGNRDRVFYAERNTPANYQEKRGECLRTQSKAILVPHGLSNGWRFSQTRPVTRKEVMI